MSNDTNLPNDSWLRTLAHGSQVWWNDPDNGISSGYYTVANILADDGVESEDTILLLKNSSGSESEVYASELSPMQPDGLYPVVDGESGEVDIFGYAMSKEEAIDVGNATFNDEVVNAYVAENILLKDGSVVPKAWVATTFELSETVTMHLVLDVKYSLNGESAAEMQRLLKRMCERAIGEGMLTGETGAEVDEYSMDVVIQPD